MPWATHWPMGYNQSSLLLEGWLGWRSVEDLYELIIRHSRIESESIFIVHDRSQFINFIELIMFRNLAFKH